MFGTYLWRELVHRRKQTIIVAIGLALAIALVILVNAVSAGVRDAQSTVLQSVYGVGTDVTVTQAPTPPTDGAQEGPRFQFGSGDGSTDGGSTTLSQSRLTVARGTTAFDASTLETVEQVDNVAAATATLSLESVTFSGQVPQQGTQAGPTDETAPRSGGPDGAGGSSFGVDSFSVQGIDVTGAAVGPLTATSLSDGRAFTASDVGTNVVVVDESYATTADLAVGDTLSIGNTDFEVIGIVASTGSDAATGSNTYIPLDVAQTLSGLTDQVTSVYVQANSAADVAQITSDLETALPDATVSTQADLASSVSGSLSTASGLVSSLGTWLSLIVLAAAFLLAVLFTISGVSRRTREFGTLKAIGWSNGRIVRQVAGESIVQGLIGGVAGIAVGLLGVFIVNLVAPTLSGSATPASAIGGPRGGAFGRPGGATQTAAATTDVVLQAPVTLSIILIAVGLAVLGGLLAGTIGGWRAARLRPAEALRSVA